MSAKPEKKKVKATKLEIEERLDKVEEMLCAGLSSGRIERSIAREYQVDERQAREYLRRVKARWDEQLHGDVPHRREQVWRMTQRFYGKALLAKDHRAAGQALGLLARLAGAFAPRAEARSKVLEGLGPMPEDTKLALPRARRLLMIEFEEVYANDALDPERRLRWLAELAAKIGMLNAASENAEALGRIEDLLQKKQLIRGQVKVVDAKSHTRPETARGGGAARGPRPLSGPVTGPGKGKDPRDPPDGGR